MRKTKRTEKFAHAGPDDIGHPLDDQEADERQEQTSHVTHDVIAVYVAQAGQGGVHGQREHQTHDGRHGAGRDQHVLPAAHAVRRRGRVPVAVGRTHVRLQHGRLARRRRRVLQAVVGGGHADADVRPVQTAVGQQCKPVAVQPVAAVGTVQPLVVRQ